MTEEPDLDLIIDMMYSELPILCNAITKGKYHPSVLMLGSAYMIAVDLTHKMILDTNLIAVQAQRMADQYMDIDYIFYNSPLLINVQ